MFEQSLNLRAGGHKKRRLTERVRRKASVEIFCDEFGDHSVAERKA